jgi:hypothetical protein
MNKVLQVPLLLCLSNSTRNKNLHLKEWALLVTHHQIKFINRLKFGFIIYGEPYIYYKSPYEFILAN